MSNVIEQVQLKRSTKSVDDLTNHRLLYGEPLVLSEDGYLVVGKENGSNVPESLFVGITDNREIAKNSISLVNGKLVDNEGNEVNIPSTANIAYAQKSGEADSAKKWTDSQNFYIQDSQGHRSPVPTSVDGSTEATLTLPTIINASLDGNALSADKWKLKRNFQISDKNGHSGETVQVDGTSNVVLNLPSQIKADLLGNANTATKLKTARTIKIANYDGTNATAGVNFDGSGDITINLPQDIKGTISGVINEATHANQADLANNANFANSAETSNTANYAINAGSATSSGSATKLSNGRTIRTNLSSTTATSFDGTSNIEVGVTGTLPANSVGAGTLKGQVVANSSAQANLNIAQIRNIYMGTDALTPGVSTLPAGSIYFQYEKV